MRKNTERKKKFMSLDLHDLPTHNDFKYTIFNRLGLPIQCWIELPTIYEENIKLWRIEDRGKKHFTREDLNLA